MLAVRILVTAVITIASLSTMSMACASSRSSFKWKMVDRVKVPYIQQLHTYDEKFINPAGWSVILDARPIKAKKDAIYEWKIVGVENDFTLVHSTDSPRIATSKGAKPIKVMETIQKRLGFGKVNLPTFRHIELEAIKQLPELGQYRVTLSVRNSADEEAFFEDTQVITLRDFLLVSLGDSLASGQGNPDKPGESKEKFGVSAKRAPELYTADIGRRMKPGETIPMKVEPVWMDQEAFRSRKSAPAQAAVELEESDPHSSVTFISLGSSGATIQQGLIEKQSVLHLHSNPRDRRDGPFSKGQVAHAAQLVGSRKVDALLISIGANDLAFGESLAKAIKDELRGSKVAGDSILGLRRLPDNLELLKKKIEKDFAVAPTTVYLTGYPTSLFEKPQGGFRNGAPFITICGRIAQHEGDIITTRARNLNNFLSKFCREATEAPSKWKTISCAQMFDDHGYCQRDSYFVQIDESFHTQGNVLGAFHPNATGQGLIAGRIAEVVYRDTVANSKRENFALDTAESLTDKQRSIALKMDSVEPARTTSELIAQHRFVKKLDVEDAIAEVERRHSNRKSLHVLSYNTFLIDPSKVDFGKGEAPHRRVRAKKISLATRGRFHVAAYSEIFQNREKDDVLSAWKDVGLLRGDSGLFKKDIGGSGLLTASKRKFAEDPVFLEFHADGSIGGVFKKTVTLKLKEAAKQFVELVASKGVLRTVIGSRVPGGNIEIYSTHFTTVGNLRDNQLKELMDFVTKQHKPENVAVICGDFNMNGRAEEGEYLIKEMAKMGFSDVWKREYGPGPTKFSGKNAERDIADPFFAAEPVRNSEEGSRLDYIFLENPTQKHGICVDAARPRRVPFPAPELHGMKHLSDHIGISVKLFIAPIK